MQSTDTRRRTTTRVFRPPAHRRARRAAIVGLVVLLVLTIAVAGRGSLAVQGSNVSRRVIGNNNTLRVEAAYFRFDDAFKRLKYRLFGGAGGTPVSTAARQHALAAVSPARTAPLGRRPMFIRGGPAIPTPDAAPAQVAPVFPHTIANGEGVWTPTSLSGAQRTPYTALHPIYTTFIRPDPARPYATVTLAEFNAASIGLVPVVGTSYNGSRSNIAGAGGIPASVMDGGALLAAFNGGFRWRDGNYGMTVDGRVISPMRDGLATLATYRDGSFRIGTWGSDIGPSPSLVSARQNAILLLEKGAISPQINAGGRTWGFVWYTSKNFFTTRSAIGLTADGRFVFAAGYEVNASTLATALRQAGVQTAMQLDVNRPYTQMALYEAPNGLIHGFNLTSWMGQSPSTFYAGRARDFVYVTIKGK